jgi:hypothetical protein
MFHNIAVLVWGFKYYEKIITKIHGFLLIALPLIFGVPALAVAA